MTFAATGPTSEFVANQTASFRTAFSVNKGKEATSCVAVRFQDGNTLDNNVDTDVTDF